LGAPKSEHREALNIEVLLTPEEARRGFVLPIGLPVRIPPIARSGSIFEIPLQGLGIHDVYLRIHVFVESEGMGVR
jgi:hypothetical protein